MTVYQHLAAAVGNLVEECYLLHLQLDSWHQEVVVVDA